METPEDNKSTFSGGCIVEPAALVFTGKIKNPIISPVAEDDIVAAADELA